jgi:C_GCAxxG_C_C family probable redox protein
MDDSKDPLNKLEEAAVEMFKSGFNCAQSVLVTCGVKRGVDRGAALKMAGPFGAGMGRLGETCGAMTGAFMVIGLKYAKTKPEDDAARDRGYELVREFARRFEELNGSITCRKLLGCELNTPEGMQRARDQELFKKICVKLVKDAVKITEELLG